jgi:hypothetical protein
MDLVIVVDPPGRSPVNAPRNGFARTQSRLKVLTKVSAMPFDGREARPQVQGRGNVTHTISFWTMKHLR